MARIKYSGLITNISGSIGGTTFQTGRSGTIIRNKPIPVQPRSSYQLSIRSIMLRVQQTWQHLSVTTRDQWNKYIAYSMQTTRLNKSITLSGHALFLKYQTIRLLAGYSMLTDLAYSPLPLHPEPIEIIIDNGHIYFNFDDDVTHTALFFLLKLSRPLSATNYFKFNSLRYMQVTPATSDTFIVDTSYLAHYGVFPTDIYKVHYSLTWFSVVSPFISKPQVGILNVSEP